MKRVMSLNSSFSDQTSPLIKKSRQEIINDYSIENLMKSTKPLSMSSNSITSRKTTVVSKKKKKAVWQTASSMSESNPTRAKANNISARTKFTL